MTAGWVSVDKVVVFNVDTLPVIEAAAMSDAADMTDAEEVVDTDESDAETADGRFG